MPNTTQTSAIPPAGGQGDENRRRLTPDECAQLLSRPLVGVFSTLAERGWIHSVPVHFLYRDGEIRVLCGSNSIKARNVDRTGRATFCVEVTQGTERRYVTVEGPARVQRPAQANDVTALDEQYARTDTADWTESDYAGEGLVILQPTRWIAWSDWD
ncbi:MAG TPA: pyridoxamine 5'-phosphate oxidase family protein [Candidatus Limnocylindrales bacterium]|nr:pyridoxamine 5'-phosphate oxidase family protein [Candidatus Limnocylindrales bacterium]